MEEGLSKAVQVERLLIGNPTKLSGKQFIFEGELDEIAAKSQTKYHAFLFEDILVYSHTKIGAFWKYKGCIELKPTLDVRVIENPQTFENVFQVVDGAEHRTFFTGTAKEMNDWVANFSKAIEAVKKKKTPEQAKDADDKAKKEKEKKEKEEKEKKEKEEKEKKEKEEKEKEKAKKDKDKEKEKEKAKKEKEKEKAKKEKEKEKEKKEKEKEKEKAKKEKEKEKERKEKEKEKERKEKEKAKKK